MSVFREAYGVSVFREACTYSRSELPYLGNANYEPKLIITE